MLLVGTRGRGPRERKNARKEERKAVVTDFGPLFFVIERAPRFEKVCLGNSVRTVPVIPTNTALRGQYFEQAFTFMATEKNEALDCEAGSEEEKRENQCSDFLVYQGKNTKKHSCKTVTVATAGTPSFVLWERHKYMFLSEATCFFSLMNWAPAPSAAKEIWISSPQ